MSPLLLAITAAVALCAGFAGVYLVARRLDNYGVVDVAWAYAFAAIAFFYAWCAEGWDLRRLLVAAMAGIWSLRLGTHLLQRVKQHHPEEDGRYRQLREDWAGAFAPRMFGFFQLQALSVVLLATPFLASAADAAPGLRALERIGVAVWLLGLAGEALADAQLRAFKRDPARRGEVCDRGLWGLSRHPNYFFEWLVWVGYALFASASPWGWAGFLSPAVILYLLLRVTGIPYTEQQAVRSKGDAYRRYQRTTSAFVPWFRRRQTPDTESSHP